MGGKWKEGDIERVRQTVKIYEIGVRVRSVTAACDDIRSIPTSEGSVSGTWPAAQGSFTFLRLSKNNFGF